MKTHRIDFSRRFLLLVPMERRRRRRALVVGYYAFFVLYATFLIWYRGPARYDRLLPLSFYLATMLGGLTFSGPVRLFSQWQRDIRTEPLGLRRLNEYRPIARPALWTEPDCSMDEPQPIPATPQETRHA